MGTSVDYSTVSHETIYHQITAGPGGATLEETSRGWQSVAAKLEELQGAVDQAVRGIGMAQQGVSAEAASHATMALMPWLDESVVAANALAARISSQAGMFAHTRDSMPPPRAVPQVSFSQDPAVWMADHAVEWLPGIQTGHERAVVAAQQDEQRARELMSGYQGVSNENLAVSQQFAAAPAVVAEVADAEVMDTVSAGAGNGGPSRPGNVHLSRSPSPSPGVVHPGPVAGRHAASPTAAPQLAAGAHQASAAPTTAQLAGSDISPGDQPVAGAARPGVVTAFGPSPIVAGPLTPGENRGRGGSRYTGGGTGGTGFGPRPSATFGTGEAVPSNRLAQEQAGRLARGGAGWTEAPIGAPGVSGRGASGSEHRRPGYLLEQDTNAIIGELPLVAPPVIGAGEEDQ